MCIWNIREDALVVFHMFLIRVHSGPRLTKFICLNLLLATFMTICMWLFSCIFSFWVVEILGGCHYEFRLHGCLQMEWPLVHAWDYANYLFIGQLLAIERIWFPSKYFIMAKLLQLFFEQLSRFWDFISTCFMMFWTCRQRKTIYIHNIGGSLHWQKEEIRRLEEISNGNEVLNKSNVNIFSPSLAKL